MSPQYNNISTYSREEDCLTLINPLQITISNSKTPLPNTETILFPSPVYHLYNLYFPLQLHACIQIPPLNPVLCDTVDCQVQKRKRAEGDRTDRASGVVTWSGKVGILILICACLIVLYRFLLPTGLLLAFKISAFLFFSICVDGIVQTAGRAPQVPSAPGPVRDP